MPGSSDDPLTSALWCLNPGKRKCVTKLASSSETWKQQSKEPAALRHLRRDVAELGQESGRVLQTQRGVLPRSVSSALVTLPSKRGHLLPKTMLDVVFGADPTEEFYISPKSQASAHGLHLKTFERLQSLVAEAIFQCTRDSINKVEAQGACKLKFAWDEVALRFNIPIDVMTTLFPELSWEESPEDAMQMDDNSDKQKGLRRRKFVIQLLQAQCTADLGETPRTRGPITIPSKVIKANNMANLYNALQKILPFLFASPLKERLADERYWNYVSPHSDSLAANLLAVIKFCEEDCPAIIDRMPCRAHQLNIAASEGSLPLDHQNPLYCLVRLLEEQTHITELLLACEVVAHDSNTNIFACIAPPDDHLFEDFLITHTYGNGCSVSFCAGFAESKIQTESF